MKNIVQSSVKIRFQDCDPFNHLYNTRYLDYFLNAREDQLLEFYGLNVFQRLAEGGQIWVVSENQVCYLRPASMQETVLIESQLIQATSRSLLVEMRMWDENKSILKSILWTNFIYFNIRTQKPEPHPAELSRLFNEIVLPVEQQTFADRKRYLTRQTRQRN